MRALVADGSGVSLAEAPDPQVDASHALVEVKAVSLNRGEVRRLPARKPGTIPGWDVAGVLSDGTRVVGLADEGGWAELAALPKDRLAVLPDDVSFEAASTLPVAGLTALRALEVGGPLLGRRVLITGAAGGVGRYAIQLAHRAGAHVTGVVRNAERGEGLRELGADELITELEPEGEPFDLLLESVGGASLAAALTRVAPAGHGRGLRRLLAGAHHLRRLGLLRPRRRRGSTACACSTSSARHRSGVRDLTLLVDELAAGRLDPQIDLVTSWQDVDTAIDALMDRRVAGKAVLTVG